MSKSSSRFRPGGNFNTLKMIHYVAQLNNRYPNGEYSNCNITCRPEIINKRFPGSDAASFRISNNMRVSQLVKTSLGGSTQYGNFYLGQPLQLNYLGNPQGIPGGSGMPPKNTF